MWSFAQGYKVINIEVMKRSVYNLKTSGVRFTYQNCSFAVGSDGGGGFHI